MTTDASLIARVQHADDRVAFGELVRRHQPMVRGFLRRMLGGAPELADDLSQETFIKAYRGLRAYRGDATFPSWLCAIAVNELRAEWRRRARRDELLEEEPMVSDVDPGLARDLSRALASLPEAQRAALVLCYEHGLTHEEAAAAMACPLGTLKSHVERGKVRLRRLLQGAEETA
jgi:RNA polymerase sigma-70 factor (ECF subfamily)